MNSYFGNSGGEQLSQQTLAQLESIPTANWANLMLLNQPVATTSSPRFFDLTITDALKLQDPGVGTNYITLAAPALTANRVVTFPDADLSFGNVPNQAVNTTSSPQFATLSLNAGGLTVGTKTLSDGQWSYLSGMNQTIATTSSPQFAKLGINQAHSGGTDVLEVNGFAKAASGFKSNAGTSALGGVDHILMQDGGVAKFSIGMTGTNGDFMLYNHATPLQAINIAQATNYVSINSTRVGINQTAGTEALEVNGTTKAAALNATTAGGLTIGTRTPSDTQWSYLTGLNQALATSSTTQFAKLGINQANTGGPFVLEINGPTFAKNFYQCDVGASYQFRMSEAGVPKWSWLMANADCDLVIGNETTSTNSIVIDSTTNYMTITCPRVGINQSAGSEALEVAGNIKTSGAGQHFISNAGGTGTIYDTPHLLMKNNNVQRHGMYLSKIETGSNVGSDLIFTVHNDIGDWINTAIYIKRSTGYVGISSTVPTEALEVGGNIKYSGTLIAPDATALANVSFTDGTNVFSIAVGRAIMQRFGRWYVFEINFTWSDKNSTTGAMYLTATNLPTFTSDSYFNVAGNTNQAKMYGQGRTGFQQIVIWRERDTSTNWIYGTDLPATGGLSISGMVYV